jgi:acyl-coenzyme A thioesterase 13
MPSRLQPITSSTSPATGFPLPGSSSSARCSPHNFENHSPVVLPTKSHSLRKVWVDPATLPDCGDAAEIAGNAPSYVKQLTSNTLASYGVGNDDCFAQAVGKAIKFVEVNINECTDRQGRLEAKTVAEVVVSKSESYILCDRRLA